ncbi:MAG: HlyC/CorC family transporter [Gammaproteobacteria bacterium]|nr:HlyC/CorC family transporter [Gammaproteobacteria bacterium]
MSEISTPILFGILFGLIVFSAFFSSSETGMMSINRYRLRSKAKQGHASARRVEALLSKRDRLIGIILIGNNFVNIFASSVATIIAIRIWGDSGIALASGALTVVILIFAEVTPKTLAAIHPERIAYPASLLLKPLLLVFYPLVWLISGISNGLLKLLRAKPQNNNPDSLNTDELRTVVHEAGTLIPSKHQDMLLSILDLEKVTVDDIMVPRNELVGIDISEDIDEITSQLQSSQHTRLPVFKKEINNIVGIFHMRNISRFWNDEELNKATLMQYTREAHFVPSGISLNMQLINFQRVKRRIGIVVDEYGDVLGLVTLEDILEEIVGEFTSDMSATSKDIHPQKDGSFLIDGTATIRDINRTLNWNMPADGPKTLNGLIIEQLEFIPEYNMCIDLFGYKIETLHMKDNIIKTARVQVDANTTKRS